MFCFKRKKTHKRTERDEELIHPSYATRTRTPPPPVVAHYPVTEPEPASKSWRSDIKGDTKQVRPTAEESKPLTEGKRVLTRSELRKLRHQSNLQLYKYSLPLLRDR
ncbi:hypothetical protein PHET_00510 [Paragonimus heterotremus]|uniref:Uncharacterized protein n=1 Tax=Paragonimus heterotremus TaxID=100268 RepID=A0A8J4TNF4_9TREM|nr:hypothetical protein PHET_00510 [Paragonimus heterotremus]